MSFKERFIEALDRAYSFTHELVTNPEKFNVYDWAKKYNQELGMQRFHLAMQSTIMYYKTRDERFREFAEKQLEKVAKNSYLGRDVRQFAKLVREYLNDLGKSQHSGVSSKTGSEVKVLPAETLSAREAWERAVGAVRDIFEGKDVKKSLREFSKAVNNLKKSAIAEAVKRESSGININKADVKEISKKIDKVDKNFDLVENLANKTGKEVSKETDKGLSNVQGIREGRSH